MVECSHYVIEEVLTLIESKDKRAAERFASLAKRYPDDLELSVARAAFAEASKNKDKAGLTAVIKTLNELKQTRKLESEGGTSLPFKDRRHFNE